MSNPLFEPSKLQFQAPLFDVIKPEHFPPAFDRGMEEQLADVASIKLNTDAPTFGNTIVALELSGRLLQRAKLIFGNLCSANTSPQLQQTEQDYAAKLSAHSDSIFQDSELYKKVMAVYESRSALTGEDRRLVEMTELRFSMAGANLSSEKKAELKGVNGRLATLETAFGKKLLGTSRSGALIVEAVDELDGLTAEELQAAQAAAVSLGYPGKYALILLNTTQQPLFVSLRNRETRRRLYYASITRAEKEDENNTCSVIDEILRLRLQKANLLGKKCFADWKLQDQMATTETATQLLHDLTGPSLAAVEKEVAEIRQLIKAQGGEFVVEPWDWAYYAEQVRREKYELDEEELRPYLEFHNVLEKGAFFAANRLFGVTMKRRTDLPVYDEDTLVYEVFDCDDKSIALFYLDPYARPNKKGGAWMTLYAHQSHVLHQQPVVFNVLNIPKPEKGKPTLLSQRHTITLFHEFGHGLHGLLSSVKYPSLAGTSVPRDFVELPSQVYEKWAWYDDVLQNYAFHWETGTPIPTSLVAKVHAADKFGGGFQTLESVAASAIDLYWHSVSEEKDFKPFAAMEAEALRHFRNDVPAVPPRYLTSYFAHSFQWGYSAAFYAYLWAKQLDCDGFEWFIEHGGLTRENGDHFRKTILSIGNSMDLNEAYYNFAGRKPGIVPMLRSRGLA